MAKKDKNLHSSQINIILVGIIFILCWWIFSVLLDVFVFKKGTFSNEIFPSDPHELWTHILVVFMIFIFSLYAYFFQRTQKLPKFWNLFPTQDTEDASTRLGSSGLKLSTWM